MHYGLDQRIRVAGLDLSLPLYGLVEACFAGHNYQTLSLVIDNQVSVTADGLNAWASH
jgi:hypothetical protein